MASKNSKAFEKAKQMNDVVQQTSDIAMAFGKAFEVEIKYLQPALKEMKDGFDLLATKVDKKDKTFVKADKLFKKGLLMFKKMGEAKAAIFKKYEASKAKAKKK